MTMEYDTSSTEGRNDDASSHCCDEDDDGNSTDGSPSVSTDLLDSSTNSTGHRSDSSSSYSIAKKETKFVQRSKRLVLLVIGLAATAVGTFTYFLIDGEEQDDFQSSFYDHAVEISDLAHVEAKNVFLAVESFGTVLTSFATEFHNASFPNVTLPHFELRGHKNNALSAALQLSFVPLISNKKDKNYRKEWEQYAAENQGWIAASLDEQQYIEQDLNMDEDFVFPRPISENIWRYKNGVVEAKSSGVAEQDGSDLDFGPADYAPVWQQAPAPRDTSIINYNLLSHPVFARIYHGMWETRLPVLSEVLDLSFLYEGAVHDDAEHPHSFLLQPLYADFEEVHERDEIVGMLVAVLSWDSYFKNLLPEGVNGIQVVLHDSCGDHFTYQIDGPRAVYLGEGDLHDRRYDYLEVDTDFAPFLKHNFSDIHDHCEYDLRIFPSSQVEEEYRTKNPGWYAAAIVMVFLFTASVFLVYDFFVKLRQDKVSATAKRTKAIVQSIFPSNVHERIMKDAEEKAEKDIAASRKGFRFGAKSQLKDFLDDEGAAAEGNKDGQQEQLASKPIADLFPEVTIMFGDIVGFTAWSSIREPSQVFTLLETIYARFDDIARKRRVFKVETVGDCYVAVAGLPDPRKDHPLVMARFARDCLTRMNDEVKKLEVTLGPDTGDLSMRIGLHSGPVTAGVLRGDKSRFQLFGDTMNTASRCESTGERNRIHVSLDTANLLKAAGKEHWLTERRDRVTAKGKGEMITYWLDLKNQAAESVRSGSSGEPSEAAVSDNENPLSKLTDGPVADAVKTAVSAKTQRLICWNVDVLARLLKQIVARRNANEPTNVRGEEILQITRVPGNTVLDEVQEVIELPQFDSKQASKQQDADCVVLSPDVMTQLRTYVSIIASMYKENPFHNFEHASHVTMSVTKLLSRIVAPEMEVGENAEDKIASLIHDHTYGITSDPLTQFACVFSALIHDVDHSGVPNTTLIKEKASIAAVYKSKSVAEQNSVDISWELLMDPAYKALRAAIYSSQEELDHFRQLVVNSVMATDIMDKEASGFRKARWEKAFSEAVTTDSESVVVNRKATIVIEHLIQASDVAHTMQHWHVYNKWNERLFFEMYRAYKNGRSDNDPAENWYQGEIGFFDFYIIPLAKKLKACGVFGVSSDEYLNYATNNRREWERKGKERVAELVDKFLQYDPSS